MDPFSIKPFLSWFRPRGWKIVALLLLNILFITVITLFVYQQKGTKLVYPHLMYIPIILSALFFRLPGGVIAAILSGLLMGPFMPLDSLTHELQSTGNWMIRLVMYSFVGGFSGLVFSLTDKNIKKIEWQACHDESTELPNRTFLLSEIRNLNKKRQNKIAIFAFEVVNYQEINMSLGYTNAEELMRMLAKKMELLPWSTSVCTLGSYLLGAGFEYENDDQFKKRIKDLNTLASTSITIENVPIFVVLKTGIDIQDPLTESDELTIMRAISAAHRALEKNLIYRIYFDGMGQQKKENLALLGRIPEALANNEFQLFYQPIIDLQSNKVFGYEALIRWFSKDSGLISPGVFIPLLEVTPLVNSVQDWVIKKAAEDAEKILANSPNQKISINISVQGLNQFLDESYLSNLLADFCCAPENLIFEITESAVMQDPETALKILDQINGYGVNLAIDDFGTGYSSMSYLKLMPIDFLKIDKVFVDDLPTSPATKEIVQATIAISKGMGFKVIAEGIETDEAYQWFKENGCDFMQGYLKAKPMSLDGLMEWLKDRQ